LNSWKTLWLLIKIQKRSRGSEKGFDESQKGSTESLVNGLNINQGIQSSLLAKLNAAAAALAADNTATACTKLQDFINECNAQSGKKLSVEQADELIARANEIRASLGCP